MADCAVRRFLGLLLKNKKGRKPCPFTTPYPYIGIELTQALEHAPRPVLFLACPQASMATEGSQSIASKLACSAELALRSLLSSGIWLNADATLLEQGIHTWLTTTESDKALHWVRSTTYR